LALLQAGRQGLIPETPPPGDEIFSRAPTLILGSNALALQAAAQQARTLHYRTLVWDQAVTGDVRAAAAFFARKAAELHGTLIDQAALHPARGDNTAAPGPGAPAPVCFLAGGETTVTLRGLGRGGRSQEMALTFLKKAAPFYRSAPPEGSQASAAFLSGGTDGTDGPTDAAGAFVLPSALRNADLAAVDRALADNDSYMYFKKTGDLLLTGPTGTNVCDLQILLIE
jgi:glycerate-2-kinase